MLYDFKRPSGKRSSIIIPDEKIKGRREDFIAKHVDFWAGAKGLPKELVSEKLGSMWDMANPAKPRATKAEAVEPVEQIEESVE